MKDFSYTVSKDESGTWYTLFPENAQAETAWSRFKNSLKAQSMPPTGRAFVVS